MPAVPHCNNVANLQRQQGSTIKAAANTTAWKMAQQEQTTKSTYSTLPPATLAGCLLLKSCSLHPQRHFKRDLFSVFKMTDGIVPDGVHKVGLSRSIGPYHRSEVLERTDDLSPGIGLEILGFNP